MPAIVMLKNVMHSRHEVTWQAGWVAVTWQPVVQEAPCFLPRLSMYEEQSNAHRSS